MTIFDVMGEGKKGVRIPKIQRDYAQGRKDADGETLRKNFIPRLFDAVFKGDRLVLDFVYGIGCGDDCSSGSLMLLDGQQRITTLFLLAWFVGQDVSQWEFSYESRRFADEFVRNLRKKRCSNQLNPIAEIERQDWYLKAYADDPSVAGSLEMLRSMADVFASYSPEDRKSFLEKADLRNVEFLVKDISTSDMEGAAFDEIYLKMNARGLPLTDWENIKAIIDKYADGEWRTNIASWEERIWTLMPCCSEEKKVEYWNIALEKLVRMTAFILWGKHDLDLVDLDEKVSQDQAFFMKASQYIQCALDPSFRMAWSKIRSANILWSPSKADDRSFVEFLIAHNTPSVALQYRFDSLVESRGWMMRKKRILLNLIDGSEISLDKLSALIAARNKFGERELSSSSIDLLAGLSQFQANEEKWKLNLDESLVIRLESDELSWNGSIEYLAWKGYGQEELVGASKELKELVYGSQGAEFFCDLLRDLQCYRRIPEEDGRGNPHSELPLQVTVPYKDTRIWAEHVFYVKRLREALYFNRLNNGSVVDVGAYWLRHLRELLSRMWCSGEKLRYVRTFEDGWTYLFSQTYTDRPKRTTSIRLDYNEIERDNRISLLGIDSRLHFGDEYRRGVNSDVYYNVYEDGDRAWWKTKDLVEYVKDSDNHYSPKS